MFKIVRFPKELEPFFESLRARFHWDHFDYFRVLVLVAAFAWNRRNISALYRCLDAENFTHRSRFNNFMLVGRWDPEEALRAKAAELVAGLDPRPGDTVRFIIDDSKKEKRGGKPKKRKRKKTAKSRAKRARNKRRPSKANKPTHDKTMEGVGWIHDPVSGRSVRGHQYVTAVLEFKGVVIPFGIRLYVKKELSRALNVEFKKVTQLAAELVEEFDPPPEVNVLVEFDSYYLCPTVVKACQRKGFHYVSTLKNNRNLFKNGRKLKAGKYGKSLFRRRGRKNSIRLGDGKSPTCYHYADAGWLKVNKLGDVHVVYSRRPGDKNILGLATDAPDLGAKEIIRNYSARWSIEVFFKDCKQLLGLGQYQNGTYRAAVTHLHLVCFAYALLTHIAIEREGAKGKKKKRERKPVASWSSRELQNELRRIVWDDLSKYLSEIQSGSQVLKELERLLIAA